MICQDLITQLEHARTHNLISYTTLTSSETKIRFTSKTLPLEHKLRLKSYIENTYNYQAWLSHDETILTVFHAKYAPLYSHNPT